MVSGRVDGVGVTKSGPIPWVTDGVVVTMGGVVVTKVAIEIVKGEMTGLVLAFAIPRGAEMVGGRVNGVGVTKSAISSAWEIMGKAHARGGLTIRIQHVNPETLRFVALHDVGWASRPDGSSQGGFIVFADHKGLIKVKKILHPS